MAFVFRCHTFFVSSTGGTPLLEVLTLEVSDSPKLKFRLQGTRRLEQNNCKRKRFRGNSIVAGSMPYSVSCA